MQLLFLLFYVFEAIIAYIYFSDNYRSKKTITVTFTVLLSLYIGAFLVNHIFNNTTYLNELVFFIINIVFAKTCFKTTLKSSIFNSAFLTTIMFITELIPQYTASYMFNIPIDAYRDSLTALVLIGITSKTLYLLVSKLVSHFFSYKKKSQIDNKKLTPLFLYPIITSATLLTFLYASTKYSFENGLNLACGIISTLSLLFCCFVFIYNQRIQNQQEELINLQALKQKKELDETFYKLLEKKNEEQRVLTHDIKHHFFAIDSMDDLSEIKNYIKEIQPRLETYQYIGKTNNKMFDLILNKYSMLAKSEGIILKTDIRFSNLSFIEDSDLVSLLGNLLDNAFEAAKKSDNKEVAMTTSNNNNFILLTIVNSCSFPPKVDNDKLITTKTDKKSHGYGTKSIEKIAEKYNGICQWDYDEKGKKFHYNILFNK